MAVPYKLTKDGFESQFQVNYLAPFLFVSTLMPILLSTAVQSGRKDRVRVVNLSSDITSMVGPKTMLLDDVNMEKTTGMTALLQVIMSVKVMGRLILCADRDTRMPNKPPNDTLVN